ncbi:MAG TPA: CDP-diacylglycerol--glycerol-3-phosphate 3-phosphatidyltransferase [Firmicutes bacterium]|nr:CDP-diacylglycerol--glycerol-3-phosphate 3-phosphatidyltransferase [Bacillota bacterium]
MNTPNKLTVLRMVLIPFFLFFLLFDLPHHYLYALILFAAASFTDFLDGHIARRDGIVTDFGKFLDPVADKLLVTSALICFIELGFTSSIVVVIIIAREFIVTSLRMVAASSQVIAANIWGKLKTVSQMVAVIAILFMQECVQAGWLPDSFPALTIGHVLMWIAAVLTLFSGLTYLKDNWKYVNTAK